MCVIFSISEKLEAIKALPSGCREVWAPRLAGGKHPEPDSSELPSPSERSTNILSAPTEHCNRGWSSRPCPRSPSSRPARDLNPGSSWPQRAGEEGEEGREDSVPPGFSSPLSPPAQSSDLWGGGRPPGGAARASQGVKGEGREKVRRWGVRPGGAPTRIWKDGLAHSFLPQLSAQSNWSVL